MDRTDEKVVREALQEARRLLTTKSSSLSGERTHEPCHEHGAAASASGEIVLEEFSALKKQKDGKGIEVVVSRKSTVVSSQNNSDDENGFPSDTEVRDAGSDEEPLKTESTVRYVRKKGGNWRRVVPTDSVTASPSAAPPQDQLEVNVKQTVDPTTGEVTKSFEARWTVLKFESLPEWLQDNEFLRHGHRPPLPSFAECFKSILSVHTETGNIWTHLIGCVAFALLALWFLTRPEHHIQLQEKLIFSFFFLGAILCLGLSFAFHTVSCHSIQVVRLFSKLDYMGISLLIIGSFVPWIYYGFYCRREPKITYISMVCVLGVLAIVVSLWDRFSESAYRPIRAGVFVGMGSSGVIPTVHYVITDGVRSLFADNSFHWLLLMAFLYLLGATLYATRTPERFYPGKFDIWFQSHQLFHVCVVVAAFVHFVGITEMADKRLTSSCPAAGGELTDAGRSMHAEF